MLRLNKLLARPIHVRVLEVTDERPDGARAAGPRAGADAQRVHLLPAPVLPRVG